MYQYKSTGSQLNCHHSPDGDVIIAKFVSNAHQKQTENLTSYSSFLEKIRPIGFNIRSVIFMYISALLTVNVE